MNYHVMKWKVKWINLVHPIFYILEVDNAEVPEIYLTHRGARKASKRYLNMENVKEVVIHYRYIPKSETYKGALMYDGET